MRVSKQPTNIKCEWRQQWQQIYDLNKFSPVILHKFKKETLGNLAGWHDRKSAQIL